MIGNHGKTLGRLIDEKLGCMEKIHELTLQMKTELDERDGENVNQLIDLRQKEMDRVDALDAEFLSVFSAVKKLLGVRDLGEISPTQAPELAGLKEKVARVNDRANRTLVIEKENEIKLKEKMASVQKEMNVVRKGKQGVRAYESAPKSNDGYFYDKKK